MVNWTSEADAKLLVAILKTAKPKIDHEAVAQFMEMDVTGYAVQHRLRKLNALTKGASSAPTTPAKSSTGKAENGLDTTPTPSPRKRAASNVNGAKPATPGRKRRSALKEDSDDDDEPMTKKAKKGVEEDCA